MADSFKLRIYTPAGLLHEDVVTSVTLPSSNGEIGVLPRHCKYTGVLGSGNLNYTTPAGDKKKITLSGGFCTFNTDTLEVLADSVTNSAELSQ